MRYQKLNEEDEKVFLSALDRIWSSIGYDCLVAIADEKGIKKKRTEYGEMSPADQVFIRRSIVIDIVTDQFAGGNLQDVTIEKNQLERIRDWMMKTPSHIVNKVVKKKFTYKVYGA